MPKQPTADALARAALVAVIAGCVVGGLALADARSSPRLPAVDPVAVAAQLDDGDARDRIRLRPGERLTVTMPDGSRREVSSLLNVTGPQSFGSFLWNEDGASHGPLWVRVDLGAQTLSVFRGTDEIGTAVILYGTPSKPTPLGWFKVLEKQRDYHSQTYDAPMPWMLRLTADGVALHASKVRKGHATHGCIGTPDEFAGRLFAAINPGDWVQIVDSQRASDQSDQTSFAAVNHIT